MHLTAKKDATFPYSYEAVRRDIVAHLFTIAWAVNMTLWEDGGHDMLGITAQDGWPDYDKFDLTRFLRESSLRSLYRYARYGEQDRDFSTDEEEGDLGRLRTLVSMSSDPVIQGYFGEVVGETDVRGRERGGLKQLVEVVEARIQLDEARESLDLDQLAVLAGVERRTVTNAMYASGEAKLNAAKSGHGQYSVPPAEAWRWLARRPNFIWTVLVERNSSLGAPAAVDRTELGAFLRKRLAREYPDRRVSGVEAIVNNESGDRIVEHGRDRAAAVLGWPTAKLDQLIEGEPSDIPADDLPYLARLLKLDPTWLRGQLAGTTVSTSSIHPETLPMAQLQKFAISPLSDAGDALDVALTDAGIRNGYIDIEVRHASRFFPEDAFGTRATDEKGQPVEFVFDARTEPTDIRLKSKSTASPRLRFSAWFKGKQAQPGDMVRFQRVAERRYTLTFVPAAR